MCAHPNPRNVFIGGGGEGATVREVLRHPSVETAVMVDIDGELCELFRTCARISSSPTPYKLFVRLFERGVDRLGFVAARMPWCTTLYRPFRSELPQYQQGAYEDARTTLVYDDCKKYLEDYEGTFDVIVLDLADPVEAGPSFPIWTVEYYTTCLQKLAPDGASHLVTLLFANPTYSSHRRSSRRMSCGLTSCSLTVYMAAGCRHSGHTGGAVLSEPSARGLHARRKNPRCRISDRFDVWSSHPFVWSFLGIQHCVQGTK